jgi:choline dehydrogenase-like flavoprotein
METYIAANVATFNHPAGTAPFGPADDPLSVADQRGRVRGVGGLRIADASLMPTIPRVPLAMTCMIIGEHVAELIDVGERSD